MLHRGDRFESGLEQWLEFHLADSGAGIGSYVLHIHDLGLMASCTTARSAWSGRHNPIMEWIKHKTKNSTVLDCSVIAYPEFLFSLSAERLAFHILGCRILGNIGTASQPALLSQYPDHLVGWNPHLGKLRNHAVILGFLSVEGPCHWGTTPRLLDLKQKQCHICKNQI